MYDSPNLEDRVDNLSPFDTLMWRAALGGEPPYSLRDAVARSFRGERDDQLTVMTILVDGVDPTERLARELVGASPKMRRLGEVGLLLFDDSLRPYVVAIWPTETPGLVHLVGTTPVTDDRWARVGRAVAACAPGLSTFVLNEADFAGIGASLAEHGRVEASRMTARVVADRSSYSRGWPAGLHAHRPTYAQALREVDGVAAVRTLTLQLEDRLSLHLRRQAGATFYSGEFELFEGIVLGSLVRAGTERRALFSNRERRSRCWPAAERIRPDHLRETPGTPWRTRMGTPRGLGSRSRVRCCVGAV